MIIPSSVPSNRTTRNMGTSKRLRISICGLLVILTCLHAQEQQHQQDSAEHYSSIEQDNGEFYEYDYEDQQQHEDSHIEDSNEQSSLHEFPAVNIISPKSAPVYRVLNPAHNSRVCSTWGNYHFKTFDGDMFHFPGKCNYLFASNCKSDFEDFSIQIRRTVKHNVPNIERINTKIEGAHFELLKDTVKFNGEEVEKLPFSFGGIQISKSGAYITMSTKIGLNLVWNEGDSLVLEVDEKFANQTCGLCGDFNGIQNYNEFIMNGAKLTELQYGNLHKLNGPLEQCEDVTENKEDGCSIHTQENVCATVLNSPAFQQCNKMVDTTRFIEMCQDDLCRCKDNTSESCICNTFTEYSRQCTHAGGEPKNWRNANLCPLECEHNMVYQECGSACQDTCSNPERLLVCDEHCKDGCVCPAGTVWDDITNTGCIPKEQCSCKINGDVYKTGTIYREKCRACTCDGGKWICADEPCVGTCSLEGGSHITTFDLSHYHFHGDCSYTLSKTCNSPEFTVLADIRKCGTSDTDTCLKSITLNMNDGKEVILIKHCGSVYVNNIYSQLPFSSASATIFKPSSVFIIVHTKMGVQIQMQVVPDMQVNIMADPSLMSKTCGLCGNFNKIQADDFKAPSGVVEGSGSSFGNLWKSQADCPNVKSIFENPCSVRTDNFDFATHWCALLIDTEGPFAPCHKTVDPSVYHKNCIQDSCKCGEKCMCTALSSYAYACSRQDIVLRGWRADVCSNYTICPEKQMFSYSVSTCQPSCLSLSKPDTTCLVNFPTLDGCICEDGMYSAENGQCVPKNACPCFKKDSLIRPGDEIHENGAVCKCLNGELTCIGGQSKQEVCRPPMVYFDCLNATAGSKGTECAKSCSTYDMECYNTECESGCMCPKGLVAAEDGECIPVEDCPCMHNDDEYAPGETIQVQCNTCTCKNRMWECTKNVCLGTCAAYGDGHYITFDGKRYRFNGDCEYTLAQDYCTSDNVGTFRVITENIPCGTTGTTCSKSIKLFLGNYEIILGDQKLNVVKREIGVYVHFVVRQMGIYLVVEAANGLVLVWDKKTTMFIKLHPSFQNQICGLCGNYDGHVGNDFITRSRSVVGDVIEFGNSWKSSASCPEAAEIKEPCLANPYRKAWSEKQCSIIMGSSFFSCHSLVDPLKYYDACVSDACACDTGGDCECFCTAVASYAQACSEAGHCINWRTPNMCPIFCDFYNREKECEWHYKPCGAPCMKTCRNPTGVCLNNLTGLAGCYPNCPPDRPYFDEDSMQCVSSCHCYDKYGHEYKPGQKMPGPNKCSVCVCTEKGIECKNQSGCCNYDGKDFLPGETIYSTVDGIGGCLTAICSDNSTINRITGQCTTTISTQTFNFTTPSAVSSSTPSGITDSSGTVSPGSSTAFQSTPTPSTIGSSTTSPGSTVIPTTCVEAYDCTWSEWYDMTKPENGEGDFETMANMRAKGYNVCKNPKDVQCRPKEYPNESAKDLNQHITCDKTQGLICLNKENPPLCYNFEIRIECCKFRECGATTKETSTQPSTEKPSSPSVGSSTTSIVTSGSEPTTSKTSTLPPETTSTLTTKSSTTSQSTESSTSVGKPTSQEPGAGTTTSQSTESTPNVGKPTSQEPGTGTSTSQSTESTTNVGKPTSQEPGTGTTTSQSTESTTSVGKPTSQEPGTETTTSQSIESTTSVGKPTSQEPSTGTTTSQSTESTTSVGKPTSQEPGTGTTTSQSTASTTSVGKPTSQEPGTGTTTSQSTEYTTSVGKPTSQEPGAGTTTSQSTESTTSVGKPTTQEPGTGATISQSTDSTTSVGKPTSQEPGTETTTSQSIESTTSVGKPTSQEPETGTTTFQSTASTTSVGKPTSQEPSTGTTTSQSTESTTSVGNPTSQEPGTGTTTSQSTASTTSVGKPTSQEPGTGTTTSQSTESTTSVGKPTSQEPGSGTSTSQSTESTTNVGKPTSQEPGTGTTTSQSTESTTSVGKPTSQEPGTETTTSQSIELTTSVGKPTSQEPETGTTTSQSTESTTSVGKPTSQEPGTGTTTSQNTESTTSVGKPTSQEPGTGKSTSQSTESTTSVGKPTSQEPGTGKSTSQSTESTTTVGKPTSQEPGTGTTTSQSTESTTSVGLPTSQEPGTGKSTSQSTESTTTVGKPTSQEPGSGTTTSQSTESATSVGKPTSKEPETGTTTSQSTETTTTTTKTEPPSSEVTTSVTTTSIPTTTCIETEKCRWTQWYDNSVPSKKSDGGDIEDLKDIKLKGGDFCTKEEVESHIECQPVNTDGQPILDNKQNVTCNMKDGLICWNRDQQKKVKCHNYRMRISCCAKYCEPVKTPPTTTSVEKPTSQEPGKETTTSQSTESTTSVSKPTSQEPSTGATTSKSTESTTSVGKPTSQEPGSGTTTSQSTESTTSVSKPTTQESSTGATISQITDSTTSVGKPTSQEPGTETTTSQTSTSLSIITGHPSTSSVTEPGTATSENCEKLRQSECYWTEWFNEETPSKEIFGEDNENTDNLRSKGIEVCKKEEVENSIECKAEQYPDLANEDIKQVFRCNVKEGLICKNIDQPGDMKECLDYKMRMECCSKTFEESCGKSTITPTTSGVIQSSSEEPDTGTTTYQSTEPTKSEPTSQEPTKGTTTSQSTESITTKGAPPSSEVTTSVTTTSLPITTCIETEKCRWTQWYDNSVPSKKSDGGDIEDLKDIKLKGGDFCTKEEVESHIECQPVNTDGQPILDNKQNVTCNMKDGLICWNRDQQKKVKCHNYRMRISCCAKYCEPVKTPPTTTSVEKPTSQEPGKETTTSQSTESTTSVSKPTSQEPSTGATTSKSTESTTSVGKPTSQEPGSGTTTSQSTESTTSVGKPTTQEPGTGATISQSTDSTTSVGKPTSQEPGTETTTSQTSTSLSIITGHPSTSSVTEPGTATSENCEKLRQSECYWTEWFNEETPSKEIFGEDNENTDNLRSKGIEVCKKEEVENSIECKAEQYPDLANEDIKQVFRCNVKEGLICKNIDQPGDMKECLDYKMRMECCSKTFEESCGKSTITPTTSGVIQSSSEEPDTGTTTYQSTEPTKGEPTSQEPGTGTTTSQTTESTTSVGKPTSQEPGTGTTTSQSTESTTSVGKPTSQEPGTGITTSQSTESTTSVGKPTSQEPGTGTTTSQSTESTTSVGKPTSQEPGTGITTSQSIELTTSVGKPTSQEPETGTTTSQSTESTTSVGKPTSQEPGTGTTTSQSTESTTSLGKSTSQEPGTGTSTSQSTESTTNVGKPTSQEPGTGTTTSQSTESTTSVGKPTSQEPGTETTTSQSIELTTSAVKPTSQEPETGTATSQSTESTTSVGKPTSQEPGTGTTTSQSTESTTSVGKPTSQEPGTGKSTSQSTESTTTVGKPTSQEPGSGTTISQSTESATSVGKPTSQEPGTETTTSQTSTSVSIITGHPSTSSVTEPGTTISENCEKLRQSECYWTEWFNEETPSKGIFGEDNENTDNLRSKGIEVCKKEEVENSIECKAEQYPDLAYEDIKQVFRCNVKEGLICKNIDQSEDMKECLDYKMRMECCSKTFVESCGKSTITPTTSGVSQPTSQEPITGKTTSQSTESTTSLGKPSSEEPGRGTTTSQSTESTTSLGKPTSEEPGTGTTPSQSTEKTTTTPSTSPAHPSSTESTGISTSETPYPKTTSSTSITSLSTVSVTSTSGTTTSSTASPLDMTSSISSTTSPSLLSTSSSTERGTRPPTSGSPSTAAAISTSTPCYCKIEENLYEQGEIIYSEKDNDGCEYYARCNETCQPEWHTGDCPTSMTTKIYPDLSSVLALTSDRSRLTFPSRRPPTGTHGHEESSSGHYYPTVGTSTVIPFTSESPEISHSSRKPTTGAEPGTSSEYSTPSTSTPGSTETSHCGPCECSMPTCETGYRVVSFRPPNACCAQITCVPDSVCVVGNATYQRGSTIPQEKDKCQECECSQDIEDGSEFYAIKCQPIMCEETCAEGYAYVKEDDECCGKCAPKQCTLKEKDDKQVQIKVGESYRPEGSTCSYYECDEEDDKPILTKVKKVCQELNISKCDEDTLKYDEDGCCQTCTQKTEVEMTEKPVHEGCSSHKVWKVLKEDDCEVEMELTYCGGPCMGSSMYSMEAHEMEHTCSCCTELEKVEKETEMICTNGERKRYTYTDVQKCGCSVAECNPKTTSEELHQTFQST